MRVVEFCGKTYRISFDAMPNRLKERLQDAGLKEYIKLLEEVQKQPRKVYQNIKDFSAKYSDVPEVINLLTFAHIQNHRIALAEQLIEDTHRKYPDYFFAKVNYADQCIRRKKLDEVVKIFPSFDLQVLSPGKDAYHTSEFRGFLILMAYYYRARKEIDRAIPYLNKAKEIEPNHPSVIYLEKKLFRKSLFRRLFRK